MTNPCATSGQVLMVSRSISTLLFAVLTVSAAILAGSTLSREFRGSGLITNALQKRSVRKHWDELKTGGTAVGNNSSSPLTIVEFSDFECPFCAQASLTLRELRSKHPDRIIVRYFHLPLQNHRFAVSAAEAAECAGDQAHFEQFHDALFANQDSIGIKPWNDFATIASVPNIDAFAECVRARRHSKRIQDDVTLATRLGIASTPTFVVNGELIRGAVPRAVLEKHLGL